METKAVYVVVSALSDIYFEQAWASIWSLKQHNAQCKVVLVTDEETLSGVRSSYRSKALPLIDEVMAYSFNSATDNKERSRWLKTHLRDLVRGNYLFIDTDTVVTGDLSSLDHTVGSLAMVEDMNCAFIENPNHERLCSRLTKLFGLKDFSLPHYFNSGVVYAKDNEEAKRFYHTWISYWERSKVQGCLLDQPALYVACKEHSDTVTLLPGIYNCQPSISIKYLATGRIIHFFNGDNAESSLSPFFTGEIYRRIKKAQQLTDGIKADVMNCKSLFASPSKIIPGGDVPAWSSNSFKLIKKLVNKHAWLFKISEYVCYKLLQWL